MASFASSRRGFIDSSVIVGRQTCSPSALARIQGDLLKALEKNVLTDSAYPRQVRGVEKQTMKSGNE